MSIKLRTCLFLILQAVGFFLAVSAGTVGVCQTDGLQIFAEKTHYFLISHGATTEVSRLRFLAVGTSFAIGWHSLILLGCAFVLSQPVGIAIHTRPPA